MSMGSLTAEPKPPAKDALPKVTHEQEFPMDLAVSQELERILESPAFRMSLRSSAFLRHVVRNAHTPEDLKERTLGVALFGRAPDYDTGADAIVRVKASEVRRRLAEYTAYADPARPVRIELQPGSYTPRIIRHEDLVDSTPAQKASVTPAIDLNGSKAIAASKSPWRRYLLLVSAVLLTCGASVVGFWAHRLDSPGHRFLRPFLGADKPIIGISHPNAYNLTRDGARGKGDAPDALHLSERLQRVGRSSRIGVAQDITVQDFTASPMILIGGPKFNYWTENLTQGLRFTFALVDGTPQITDRLRPTRFWTDPPTLDAQKKDGYVVLTRLLSTQHQKAVLSIAGLRAVDTRVGAELIPDADTLDRLLKDAPDGWESKNLQWVLQVSQLGNHPPEIKLRAATYW
jgi:hypothetical protein